MMHPWWMVDHFTEREGIVLPLRDLFSKPNCFNRFNVTGMIAGGVTFAICTGMTFFTAQRTSSRLESSLSNFVARLFNQTLSIPVPEINVPVPSFNLSSNVSTEFLVKIFNDFLNQSGIQLSNEQLQALNQTVMINMKSPPNISLSLNVDDISFSLLTLIGSSLDTIDNDIANASDNVYTVLIVIGFLFSVLIANAVLDKFLNYSYSHPPREDERICAP